MMKREVNISINKKRALLLLISAFIALASFDVMAASCVVQYDKNNNVMPECPDGRQARYDISPKCIEDANKSSDSCLNTMPVTNVSRVPEDICFRGQGWSRKRSHQGMDYAAPIGTAVTAAMDGVITKYTFGIAEPARGVCQGSGYGNVIYIEHEGCDGKYTTRYGHLTNKPISGLKEGSKVKKGDLIGYVGGTGGACGRPHLHFELRKGDTLINPMCDQIQSVCNCKTPVPSSGLSKCKDTTFAASSSTPIDANASVTAVSITQASYSETPAKSSNSCAPYEEVRNSYREWGCLFCKPFEILFNTASVMAKQSFEIMAEAVIVVVVVAFAIWLAILILRFVSTMEIREPRVFVKTMLNQAFRVLIVVILLNSGLSRILALSIDPVFSTGLGIAQLAGKTSDTCNLDDEKLSIVGPEQGGLSQSMGRGILCTVKAVQDQIGDILALGRVCFCLAFSSENRVFFVFPHLGYLLTGIAFYIAGFLLLFIYPFLLIDCVLKLSIAVALLPAALGAFAFKVTASYLNKIWEIFLNAVFAFIFMSIVIFIIASIAADTLSEILTSEVGIFIKFFWWMVEVVKVIAVCFLGWAVLGEIKTFADSFAKGLGFDGDGIGSPTGSSAMELGVKRPGLFVGKAAYKKAKDAGSMAKDVVSEKMHRATVNSWKDYAQTKGNVVYDDNNKVMTDKDGNVVYDTTNAWQKLIGRKEYRSFSTDANGNTRMNVSVETKKGRKIETATDSYATVRKKYDKKGNLVYNDTQKNAVFMKHAMRKNGTYNKEVIDDFMQNSLLNEEDKQIMFVKTVISSRMNGEQSAQILNDAYQSRTVEKSKDEKGRETISVKQVNIDGTQSTFKITLGDNDRVMSEVTTMNSSGKGKSFTSDGIVERKSYISIQKDVNGNTMTMVKNQYAFAKYYSGLTNRPMYSDGEISNVIPADEIMFGKEDMDKFANQIANKGNKAYTFSEFN